jgi:glutathione peroxidase
LRAKFIFIISVLTLILAPLPGRAAKSPGLFDIPVKKIEGELATLAEYKGKVLLIVNTASECGFTPQYKGLEELYQKYKDRGFVVLAFPSNDFGGQEPGTEKEIKKFCELKYKTTFPLFAKVGVKEKPHPLYAFLQGKAGEKVGWNFGKFLIGKDGQLIHYFPSKITPEELGKDVEAALNK